MSFADKIPPKRGRNFEENYFQNYAGQTYAKEYPESELAFIRNKDIPFWISAAGKGSF